jgi:hypothetical protein
MVPAAADDKRSPGDVPPLQALAVRLDAEIARFEIVKTPDNLDVLRICLQDLRLRIGTAVGASGAVQKRLMVELRETTVLLSDLERDLAIHARLNKGGASYSDNLKPNLDRIRDSSIDIASRLDEIRSAVQKIIATLPS